MPQIDGEKVLYPELSYKICGCCFKIHNLLGRFRTERQYADALEQLFVAEHINFAREFAIPMSFLGERPRSNIVDFLIDDIIILELKAKQIITKEDYFQTRRYLSASDKKLGILINFRQKFLAPKRILV